MVLVAKMGAGAFAEPAAALVPRSCELPCWSTPRFGRQRSLCWVSLPCHAARAPWTRDGADELESLCESGPSLNTSGVHGCSGRVTPGSPAAAHSTHWRRRRPATAASSRRAVCSSSLNLLCCCWSRSGTGMATLHPLLAQQPGSANLLCTPAGTCVQGCCHAAADSPAQVRAVGCRLTHLAALHLKVCDVAAPTLLPYTAIRTVWSGDPHPPARPAAASDRDWGSSCAQVMQP